MFSIKNFKTEKERIHESLEKNKELDFLPNVQIFNHKFRERYVDKEIQPELKFTSKTSLERIENLI